MTISSSNRKAGPFTGNGVTVAFPFAFKVFTTADVLVVQAVTATGVETTLALGTNYTVSLNADQNANPGGTITALVAPPTGTTLTATSQVGNLQPMDLTNAGGFYPKVLNDAADRAAIQIQQLAEGLSRAVKVPISSPTLPTEYLSVMTALEASAASSAAAAQNSKDAAQVSLDDFKGRYYGALAADPALDPLGSAPTAGDMYFNTTPGNEALYTYSDGRWVRAPIIAESDLQSLLLTPKSLYTALADPLLPMPAFIEGWALNSFHGVAYQTPAAAGIPLDSMSQVKLEYTVSGAAGAAALTILAGDESKGTGAWGGVVQHDDGTYGLYGITSLGGGVCTVYPNLRATVTNKTLRNLGGTVNGQHYTEPGYRALARKIFNTTLGSAYRLRYAAKWDASQGVKEDWTAVGGLGAGQFNILISNNAVNDGRMAGSFTSRGRRTLGADPTTPHTGKGLTKTFALGGSSGFLEMFVSRVKLTAGGGFAPFRAVVVVDGVTLLDQTFTANDGLQRVVVPYANGTSGTVTVTCASEESGYYTIHLGEVTWWTYDRTAYGFAWTDSVIDKNAKTVVLGDSWTTFYPATVGGVDGALGQELQAAMTAAGGTGTVKSVGTGGTTAEFGLTEFDTKVAPESPKQVVILYFTNDHNQYGTYGYGRWLTALYKLGRKCQAIGARPIFIMPLPTQSFGQAIDHGVWGDEIGAGLLK